jgi:hypothetical protein
MNLPNLPADVDQTPMGLCRLSSAAQLAKISPETFEKGIEEGAIPLELIRIGQRLKYVRSTDLAAWLSGKNPL